MARNLVSRRDSNRESIHVNQMIDTYFSINQKNSSSVFIKELF